MNPEVIELNVKDLATLVTPTEYANLCGVKRQAIGLRLKSTNNPLERIYVDPTPILEYIKGTSSREDGGLSKTRTSLYRSCLDSIAKGNPLALIDTKVFPPSKLSTGRQRKVKADNQLGVGVSKAKLKAEEKGFTFQSKSAGYVLIKEGQDEILCKNLAEVYSHLN